MCVRFRYNARLRQRLKTVEFVVDRTDWTLPRQHKADTLVPLRIEAADMQALLQAKAAGGRWVWFVKYGKIAGTALEKHMHVYASG